MRLLLASHLIATFAAQESGQLRWQTCERAALAVNWPTYLAPDTDARISRNEGVTCTYIYTLSGIITHGLLDLARDHQPSFSPFW